jgi:hypothetical protein
MQTTDSVSRTTWNGVKKTTRIPTRIPEESGDLGNADPEGWLACHFRETVIIVCLLHLAFIAHVLQCITPQQVQQVTNIILPQLERRRKKEHLKQLVSNTIILPNRRGREVI